ncbi:S8 family serine peptidase [Gammaproteobacteria bacterium AB-CW1]|uniref:S8 family serine peptidase n=1 Tax=Natronospira elongata TaxID=3110268 RepID=A0AAP6JDC1_9GAMM|nr:S8 family serine peptidase [Gammaproteobacteria bacterium AB-CW1]
MLNQSSMRLRLLGLAAAITALPATASATVLGPALEAKLDQLGPQDTAEVIVSFDSDGPLGEEQVSLLESLGLSGVHFQALPMAAAVATPSQIAALAEKDQVRSIYFNKELSYSNRDARDLTGVERMRSDVNLRNAMGLPYSGAGIGVMVNDSGIDATHPDLTFGDKTVQNVFGTTNLNAVDGMLPITWVEDVPDTDIASGHGTHVAGTIAGTGAASGGEHAGMAPGADLIGYGSGAVLLLVDTIGAFDYALVNQFRYNIRVIQNSWGSPGDAGNDFDPDHPTAIATKRLADRNVMVVFSAGNSGSGEDTIGGSFMKAPWIVRVGAANKDGTLADFSSRGKRGGGGTVEVDGEVFEWVDRPTVVAPGVDIISAMANSGVLSLLDPKDAHYAYMSGTSMSGPVVAGIVALMLEANPQLHWSDIIRILEDTATNMPGREDWEVGAGMVNAHAAVIAAAGIRDDYGLTQTLNRDFNAEVQQSRIEGPDFALEYDPLLDSGPETFHVEAGLSTVIATANASDNTVAIVLTDPDGNRYGSGVSLPLLGPSIAVTAPAVPGEWQIEARGIGAVSGVALDPLGLTNGVGLPGTVNASVDFMRVEGFTGLNDIDGHPAQGLIEQGVAERLLDARVGGNYEPDQALTRAELADYLTQGGGIRQFRPSDGSDSLLDVGGLDLATAEAVSVRGAAQRDLRHTQDAVVPVQSDTAFDPDGVVERAELAYSLIQTLGLQAEAQAVRDNLGDEPVTVEVLGERVALEDDDAIPAELKGHVQLALDFRLMHVDYSLEQGPFELEPTIRAHFRPGDVLTRAEYALSAVNLLDRFSQSD